MFGFPSMGPSNHPFTDGMFHEILVGGLEHFLFSHILGIIIPIDFHIFQRGGPTTNQNKPSSYWGIPHDELETPMFAHFLRGEAPGSLPLSGTAVWAGKNGGEMAVKWCFKGESRVQ